MSAGKRRSSFQSTAAEELFQTFSGWKGAMSAGQNRSGEVLARLGMQGTTSFDSCHSELRKGLKKNDNES